MSNCNIAQLDDRAVIRISGTDADSFLKGLITNDVQDVVSNGEEQPSGNSLKTCFAGLLTPQGKILFDFFVVKKGDTYYLDVNAASADDLIKRLTFYKLRADVAIESLKDSHTVWVIWKAQGTQIDEGLCYPDPRLKTLGLRCISEIAPNLAGNCKPSSEAEYHAYRISLGVPEGVRDYAYGDTFPHDACYDLLGGVDFKKGCYVGQEVVSRMLHRGTARTRVVIVDAQSNFPKAGAELLADGKPVGKTGIPADNCAIALIRLDRAARAIENAQDITAAGIQVTLTPPTWADYEIPSVKTE